METPLASPGKGMTWAKLHRQGGSGLSEKSTPVGQVKGRANQLEGGEGMAERG